VKPPVSRSLISVVIPSIQVGFFNFHKINVDRLAREVVIPSIQVGFFNQWAWHDAEWHEYSRNPFYSGRFFQCF